MNKPAPKEPSMDEILSSIRQIIADDDATTAPPAAQRPVPAPQPTSATPAPAPRPLAAQIASKPAGEPLALSTAQMIPAKPAPAPAALNPEPEPAPSVNMDFASMLSDIEEPEDEPMADILQNPPELVDPEDIAFEAEPEPEPPPPPVMRTPPPAPRTVEPPRPAPRPPAASVAQAAPMPDPMLSSDMADQLLAPATDMAVQGAMARLGAMAGGGIGGMTVEGMIRDMLRPMLKDWLDENLPALVERMVEKEIARISRGVK
jgi:cell pole-organizing protein PopZ